MPEMDNCLNCGHVYCSSCGDGICPRCGYDPADCEEDVICFEADPELDAAINAGGEQDGLYSLEEVLHRRRSDMPPAA